MNRFAKSQLRAGALVVVGQRFELEPFGLREDFQEGRPPEAKHNGAIRLREDPESAGRVHVGRHVTVAPGADVEIVVEGGGCLIVPDGSSLEGRVRERVHPGESKTLSS